ncbi:MAG: 50S ribosomal protein L35ae [Candidatus Pacearchaeota archaeon]
MKAVVVSFRRGRKTYKPRQFILQVQGINNKEKASEMINKNVVWRSPSGKEIKGTITATHGNKGLVRALFEKGLPGQAINTEVEIL